MEFRRYKKGIKRFGCAQVPMEEVIGSAKIIVLVSHDMDAVERICNRAIYLDGGRVVADGAPQDVIREYRQTLHVG